jgi:hypothetical protein
MPGLADDGLGVRHFDNFTQIHHHDPMAEVFDYSQIMRYKQEGDPALLLQILQEVDDLGLNGNVQGADRLITDKQFRLNSQSPRDSNALALAAAEFMGVALRVDRVEADRPEQFGDSRLPGRIVLCEPMNVEGFTDDVFDCHARVERAIRILKDHLQPSSMPAQFGAMQSGYVTLSKPDLSGGGSDEADNCTPERGLTAATFADEAEGFTGSYRKGDVVYGSNEGSV